jgi:translation initiation factor IF-2
MSTKPENKTIERSPVVCVMGHIDHGKSTLLDFIRKSNTVDTEAGGITQRISAYEVVRTASDGTKRCITFLDTPGHEAFQKMRERGAIVADIAILVVSAEDGVKRQTMEAHSAIVKAGIPYIVAINKIDKPNADAERTKLTLAENGIYLEGYGGDVSYVAISAKTGQGIDDLLDIVSLTADIAGLKGNLNVPAEGYIIETERDAKRGVSAAVIVKDGEIETGLFIVCGTSMAPVRAIDNHIGKRVDMVGPSCPARISGWDSVPDVGEPFKCFETKKEAEAAIDEEKARLAKNKKVVLVDPKAVADVDVTKLVIPVVVKADARGSAEALEHELAKIRHERVSIKLVNLGIGDIGEADLKMIVGTEGAVALGFNVKVDAQARALAERAHIPVHTFDIIYKLTEWLDEYSKTHAPKITVEEIIGEAKILKLFSKNKDKQICGGKVLKDSINLGHKIKIIRKDVQVAEGVIRELQQQKEKAGEVREGYEFGTMIECSIEIAPGDIIKDFILVEKQ